MMTKNEYLIVQMKLQELRRQRGWLVQTYAELEQQVEQTPTTIEQLRTLFTGLQKIKMAEIALHPDVANLEPLLNNMHFSEETISFWRDRLAKELPQGRLRSELIYIFGAMLEEWVQEKSQEMAPDPAGVHACAQYLDFASQPVVSAPRLTLLDRLFAERSTEEKDDAVWFQQFADTMLQERITDTELKTVLEHLSISSHHTEVINRQAKGFLQDSIMRKEMADALSLVLARLDEWDWPAEGVTAFPLWTMNKWRLFVTYDLFTMCFLEVLGIRLQRAFLRFVTAKQNDNAKQMRELLAEKTHTNAEVLMEQVTRLYRLSNNDIWTNLRTQPGAPVTPQDFKKDSDAHYYSIVRQRQSLRTKLQKACTEPGGYETHNSIDGMKTALQFINAEIQLARTAFPHDPLYVLKLDIKDFYPSLSHDLLITLLERYDFSERQLAFFRKFLQVKVGKEDGQAHILRGVPLHHRFANVLGEMVLNLLDQHILRQARVQIIRLVDDICILTPNAEELTKAWQAAQEFCQDVELTLNQEKCGAVGINGKLPEHLPNSLPTWLLIKLNQDGEWEVDTNALTTYQEQAQQRVIQHPSLLTQIEVYNQHVKHLIRATAMEVDLGDTHRRSIATAITQFHKAFFRSEHGMIEALHEAIQKRFLINNATLILPEAWFYWLITAGGCGLTQAMILASGYAENQATKEKKSIPTKHYTNLQSEDNDWQKFFRSFTRSIDLQKPVETKGMEVLVTDFIQRSNEMGNKNQTTLGAYWRWIVYIYGPQILAQLGTFRFLSTELVPLQIILQHYKPTQSEEDSPSDESNDPLAWDQDDHPF